MRGNAYTSCQGVTTPDPDKPSQSHYGIIGLFFIVLTIGVIGFASLPRAVGNKIVVFVSPWSRPTAAVEVIARAGGAFVGTGNRPWIAIGVSDKDGFVSRLYRSGAWFVGSGEAFSACLPASLLKERRLEPPSLDGSTE
ncbi:hypothetical protein [uncultured Cohaesibacter sp.]|uniref:hypothetical protein n=1 Tax=uncultured Cohaesibacter sp. TaxID=1002546 RepID=UPI0029C717A6|nr:hypothetical protein [uncultured Cohaesibacter sp.]